MIDKTILHYKILEKIGEGGMGIVYLAEDLNLERKVAIKFLPKHVSGNPEERERFKVEAKAAAALNHPNIATIHTIEETDGNEEVGETFIIMEYIDGMELKSIIKLGVDLPLPVNIILNYATQIANGIESAHKKAIVHGDIKSSNIMITESGSVKVMDFGLAQIMGVKFASDFDSTVGTTPYMSPEQLRGEEVDQRSDIWSFGVVLYEMITGNLPFTGDYEQAISYSIINETPQPLSSYRKDIPEELENILDKCLAKEKEERFTSITDVAARLTSLRENTLAGNVSEKSNVIGILKNKKIAAAAMAIVLLIISLFTYWNIASNNKSTDTTVNTSLKRIAVIPFTNINNNADVNFLSFALADQIINSLAYVKNIIVRPSSAIRPYQNKVIDPSEIAKKLNVDYILSGSYQKESSEIRLNLELVDMRSNDLIWHEGIAEKYDDAFKIQDIVSRKVVDGLKVEFSQGDAAGKMQDISSNPLAYEYFLRAVSYPVNNQGNIMAIALLQKSIQIDSNFAPVYSELGFRYHTLATYDPSERNKLLDAEAAYKKALSLNKESLSALGNLSSLYTETGKTVAAVELTKKALEINPNNAQIHFWLGYIFRYTGLLDKAVEEMETAVRLDPSNPRFRSIGVTYLYKQEYQKAINGLNLDPDSPYSRAFKGQIYFRLNMIDSAKLYFNKIILAEPEGSLGRWSTALLDYIDNKKEHGLKMIKLLETSNAFDAEQFYNYANLYGLYGETKDCTRLLRRAIEGGFFCYPYMQRDTFLDPVRSDAAFKKLLLLAQSKYEEFKKSVK